MMGEKKLKTHICKEDYYIKLQERCVYMIDLASRLSLLKIHLNLEFGCDPDQKPIGMDVA